MTVRGLVRQTRQVRFAPDALRQVPGLTVVQIGGAGGQTSVFTRGTNADHVKVLIDGIDANDPSTPNREHLRQAALPVTL